MSEEVKKIEIPEESRKPILELWARFKQSQDETNRRYTGFQEFIVYMKQSQNVPMNERWEITPDASAFVKVPESQPVPVAEAGPEASA